CRSPDAAPPCRRLRSAQENAPSLLDFWRVATDGRASLIRPYREHRLRSMRELGRAAGPWLSPETVIRETAELVTHARCLATRFEAARQVSFGCTWIGLKNREL